MMSLEAKYANDPGLLEFYKKNLIKPGWAGELNQDEFRYIKSELQHSPSLKRRWGFRPSAKRLSAQHIMAVARDSFSANKRRVLASVEVKQKAIKGDRSQKGMSLLRLDTKTEIKRSLKQTECRVLDNERLGGIKTG